MLIHSFYQIRCYNYVQNSIILICKNIHKTILVIVKHRYILPNLSLLRRLESPKHIQLLWDTHLHGYDGLIYKPSLIKFFRYWPYSVLESFSAWARTCCVEIKPLRHAISSKHAILSPCLFSIVATYWPASSNESCVPASSQAKPRPKSSTFSLFSFRYNSLSEVISSSPRADGLTCLAYSTTLLS